MATPTLSPEQKSLQLLATFRPLVGIMAHKERTWKAKQCAIIAVKEIIESDPYSPYGGGYYELPSDRIDEAKAYWESVLKHLKSL